jgi:PKD repeat protein
MKSYIFFLLLLLSITAFAQDATFSGIINTYHPVANIDECAVGITIDDASLLSAGQKVLIIQMQGASINESNNAGFGDISSIGSCGLFELAIIANISGNEVFLENTLIHSYDTNGKVQLISIPDAENATVSSSLSALSWNGNTGGVIAIWVDQTLSLNANIQADGTGFRGGNPLINDGNDCTWLVNQDNYFYGIDNWRGARKGEGIATFINGKEAGRGAQATGGGGGNDHNAGGGGGANLSTGGNGGVNAEPAFFGCDGDFPGIGGKNFNTNNRAFLGGGGGAGHENNNSATAGGNGGGIIIIKAQNIIGNGFSLSANGIAAENTSGEGAGGGGAAGTIVLDIANLTDLEISLQGGNGGQIDNQNQERCHGPGGGGSGGHLLHNLSFTPVTLLTGGNAGLSINSSDGACPDGTNGAQNGSTGLINSLDSIPNSDILNAPPSILQQEENVLACEGETLELLIELNRPDLQFQWQVDTGNGFEDVQDNTIYSGANTNQLIIQNVDLLFSTYSFQLIISNSCFDDVISNPIAITVQEAPLADFTFNNVGLSIQFTNQSQNADSYLWDFGDSQTSMDENPVHLYDTDGQYEVTLCAINNCDTVCTSMIVQLLSSPTANFSADDTEGCVPFTVQFNNLSSDNSSSFEWTFPGGTPGFSDLENPVITYNEVGSFDVILQATNDAGSNEITFEDYIIVGDVPTVDFDISVNNLSVNFDNLSVNADNYLWDFGDSQTSTSPSPSHTYDTDGSYTVVLTAFNECGSNSIAQTVVVGAFPVAAFTVVTPNGCDPHTAVFSDQSSGNFDTYFWEFPGGVPNTSSDPNPIITYPNVGTYNVSLTVSGNIGSNTFELEEAVSVIPKPEPSFDFEINGSEVTFTNNSMNASSYTWDFGDGNTSFDVNPIHNYLEPGMYVVSLNAQNAFCGSVETVNITISTNNTSEIEATNIQIYPNPAKDYLFINSQQKGQGKIFSLTGQKMQEFTFEQNYQLDLVSIPSGIYFIQVDIDGHVVTQKFTKI